MEIPMAFQLISTFLPLLLVAVLATLNVWNCEDGTNEHHPTEN